MNKQDEHKEPDKLKDLLGKAKGQGMETMDDFEKEALEGFDQLASEEEAFALKSQLDAKIERELFSKSSRKSSPFYWMAAAGLLLVIGLSVLFILQNNEKEQRKLALAEPKSKTQVPPEPAISSETVVTEQAKTSVKTVVHEQNHQATEPRLLSGSEDAVYRSSGSGAADKEADDAASSVEKAPLQLQEVETIATDEVVLEDTKQSTNKSDVKRVAKQEESEVVESTSKKSKALKTAEVSPSLATSQVPEQVITQPSSSPGLNYSYSGGSPMNTNGSLSNSPMQVNVYTIATCHYKGGKKALVKELKGILESKHLSKAFEVRLKINAAKAVEKVEFIHAEKLSLEEKQGIEAILKKLDKFYFDSALKSGEFLPYDLKYKP